MYNNIMDMAKPWPHRLMIPIVFSELHIVMKVTKVKRMPH